MICLSGLEWLGEFSTSFLKHLIHDPIPNFGFCSSFKLVVGQEQIAGINVKHSSAWVFDCEPIKMVNMFKSLDTCVYVRPVSKDEFQQSDVFVSRFTFTINRAQMPPVYAKDFL